jgi:hypothetical protein
MVAVWAAAVAHGAPSGRCAAAAKERHGRTPLALGAAGAREPKRTRYVRPGFPSRWPKACRSTHFLHEFLIGPDGKVDQVWTVRASCREIDKVIVTAIREWEYEPKEVEGKPIPVCVTVQTIVDLR